MGYLSRSHLLQHLVHILLGRLSLENLLNRIDFRGLLLRNHLDRYRIILDVRNNLRNLLLCLGLLLEAEECSELILEVTVL